MTIKSRAGQAGVLFTLAAFMGALQGSGGAAAQTIAAASTPAGSAVQANAVKGQAAIAAWRQGFKTGDFKALMAMFDDNIEFRFGVPPYNIIRKGKAEAAKALQALQALAIRVDQNPIGAPMFGGTSTTFEFIAKGTVAGKPAEANLLVVFDIVNGKIVRMYEYAPPA